jgi:polyisoprenoid-binding protein YceI
VVAATTSEPVEAQAPEPTAPLAATAAADPAATPAPAPALKDPVAWKVQPGSTVAFATRWSDTPIEGRFDRWTADILFSPEALDRSKVTVSIDVGSVNTGDSQRDASLPSADWFDADAHPKATFTATRFEKTGEGRYVARGELSLRGVRRSLSLPFRLKIDGDRAEVSGVTSLDRTAFGVGQGEWTSTEQIPGKVTVRVTVKAKRM